MRTPEDLERARFAFLNASQNLIGQGRFEQVEHATRRVLVDDPGFIEARFMLGFLLSRSGRWLEAEEQLKIVVQAQPKRVDSLFALATAKKMLGQLPEAADLWAECAKLEPQNGRILAELGQVQLLLCWALAAIKSLRAAATLNPSDAAIHHALADAYALNDQVSESRDEFKQAVRLDPNRVESIAGLVQQLVRLGDFDGAFRALETGVQHRPDSALLRSLLGGAHSERGELAKAEASYLKAIELDPSAVQSYAAWLQEQGRFEESADRLGDSIRANPRQGLAYYRLTEVKRFELDGRRLIEMAVPVYKEGKLRGVERMFLMYALGKLYAQAREFGEAMRFFDLANAAAFEIYNSGRPLDQDAERRITDRRIGRFDKQWLAKQALSGSASDIPIFIVGMIRSGTTLLDQILSSHPDVTAAGELKFWMTEADRFAMGEARRSEQVATEYLEALGPGSRRVTDKMPLNYAYLGLIHSIFPKARILHIRRNPLDTCLSIYSTHFGMGPRFAYDKHNIVFNYGEYLRLMEHWRTVLPAEVLFELDYEGLVADPRRVAREVVSFCGLEWDERCLSHQSAEGSIRTPSRWQARQPVYRSSVERWRSYEGLLGGFDALLELL